MKKNNFKSHNGKYHLLGQKDDDRTFVLKVNDLWDEETQDIKTLSEEEWDEFVEKMKKKMRDKHTKE